MKICLSWCIVIIAITEAAFSDTKDPPKELLVDLGDDVKMELILIPAGSFTMGEKNGRNDEKPTHKVNITKPFYLGKYEVTQEQWEAVMGHKQLSKFKGAENPVDSISWNSCKAFLVKLNAKTNG
jgi:formylglycine-generating enzyme required for sulfatase activity